MIGSWETTFGLTNDYTQYRVFSNSEYKPTFFHTLNFYQGEKGKSGTFTDVITPLVLPGQNNEELKLGSRISGTWEVKNNNLFLYYDENSFSLINADTLSRNDRLILEERLKLEFLDKYKTKGAEGLSYEIVHKNNKTGLEIKFGNTKVTLKKEDKN